MLNFPGLKLYSGDAWQWSESLSDYSPDDYDMKIVIKMGTNAAVIFSSQSSIINGEKVFVFSANATKTNIPTGVYFYQIKLTNKTDLLTNTIAEGKISVLANLESNQDPREYWLQVVEALQDIYLRLSKRETNESTYNGRTFKYRDLAALRAEILNAEIRAGVVPKQKRILEVG